MSKNVYNNNHDLSPAESDADYLTYKCINELIPYLEELDYSEGTLEYFKSFKDVDLLTNLKNKYELNFNDIYTNSPSYDYCNMTRTKDIYKPASVLAYNQNRKETFFKDKNKYSFDERLEYGLQLTNFEFIDYYNKIYNKMNQEVEYVRKLKR